MAESLYTVPLAHGRTLWLRSEGPRRIPLYRLGIWSEAGMQAGGVTMTGPELEEFMLAVEHLGKILALHGLPVEVA